MSSNMEICSYMNTKLGNFLGKNHIVTKFLSAGYFACVYECLYTIVNRLEVVKITMTEPDSSSRALKEISIMERLQHLDPDECNIVRYYGSFSHGLHLCFRFEFLDQSLKDYMKEKHKRGLPLPELRPVIHQLATALSHLSSVGIIHADVRPENVMIVDRLQTPLRVKLIDFGNAHAVSTADPYRLMQHIWLQSPEALLASPYNEAIDMWSLGLMAAELATGHKLYTGETQYDMLKTITKTQGQPSDKVLDYGRDTHFFFTREVNSERRWRLKTPEEFMAQINTSGLDSEDDDEGNGKLESLDDLLKLMCEDHDHQRHQYLLVDLIKRMLHLDQNQRIKPQEVLQHPFFTELLPQKCIWKCIMALHQMDLGP